MAVGSIVCGVLSIVFGIVLLGAQWLGIVLGVVGIVLGALAKKSNPASGGAAIAGIVISCIGLIISVITYSACVACKACVNFIVGLFK